VPLKEDQQKQKDDEPPRYPVPIHSFGGSDYRWLWSGNRLVVMMNLRVLFD
jgi:hypothetical protein